ncbi:MAG TPA: hypothetical protein VK815_08865 [Candidatus Acidoferrales bacterium]|jgi:hypothetical protein|nr:hypothetical protein [Candidatus Acidoferrales bacterium]
MSMTDGSSGSLGDNEDIAIFLDGLPVEVPVGRSTPNSIRCYLETLALENQRVLCALHIDGYPANLALPLPRFGKFSRMEAESVALDESVLLLLKTAFQQTNHARECVETALTLVLINNADVARELWWNLASQLKEPVLTLSLLPDHLCGQNGGSASLKQLRKWQLEQVAAIIRDVDQACHTGDTIHISNALESRVLPWLERLAELIQLWHETAMAGSRLGIKHGTF